MANGNGHNGKNKTGRKAVVLTQRQVEQVYLMACKCATEEHIGNVVADVCADTFRAIKLRDERVSLALQKGYADVESKLHSAMYEHALKGNVGMMALLLKARYGFSERQVVQHAAADDQPVSFSLTIGDGHGNG